MLNKKIKNRILWNKYRRSLAGKFEAEIMTKRIAQLEAREDQLEALWSETLSAWALEHPETPSDISQDRHAILNWEKRRDELFSQELFDDSEHELALVQLATKHYPANKNRERVLEAGSTKVLRKLERQRHLLATRMKKRAEILAQVPGHYYASAWRSGEPGPLRNISIN